MSTVKTTNLQHPSASDVGITLGADGSVVLPQGFAGGLGTNVVQTVKTDVFSTTSSSFTTVTGLTATITPTSATSQVLIIAQLSMGANPSGYAQLFGGNTAGYIGDASSSRVRATVGHFTNDSSVFAIKDSMSSTSLVFLDSPNTTSATTYEVRVRRGNSGTVYVNRSDNDGNSTDYGRGASSITVIEVAA